MRKKINFKLNKGEICLVLAGTLIGGIIGYSQAPLIYCIRAPCNQIYQIPYTIYGLLIGGALTYLIEVIHNNFRRRP